MSHLNAECNIHYIWDVILRNLRGDIDDLVLDVTDLEDLRRFVKVCLKRVSMNLNHSENNKLVTRYSFTLLHTDKSKFLSMTLLDLDPTTWKLQLGDQSVKSKSRNAEQVQPRNLRLTFRREDGVDQLPSFITSFRKTPRRKRVCLTFSISNKRAAS